MIGNKKPSRAATKAAKNLWADIMNNDLYGLAAIGKQFDAFAAARVAEAVVAERERILSFTQKVLENDELGWGESFDLVIAWIAGGAK